jgi:hypothetical protein
MTQIQAKGKLCQAVAYHAELRGNWRKNQGVGQEEEVLNRRL